MEAVMLNGMNPDDSWIASLEGVLVDALEGSAWDVGRFTLHEIDVRPCGGCFGCWLQTPGRCVNADTDEIAAAVARSDLMVFLTPVTFGGYGSQLKKVLDHLICLILPFFKTVEGETHHVPRYEKRPDLLVIGTTAHHDAESEAVFATLAERNAINLSAPRWATAVIAEERGPGAARQVVQGLLADVEVRC